MRTHHPRRGAKGPRGRENSSTSSNPPGRSTRTYLVNQPGEVSEYGNVEYILLHKIIEVVSGMQYQDYLAKAILQPVSLENTQLITDNYSPEDLIPAYIYNSDSGDFTPEPEYYVSQFFGAGGMYSTIADLQKFDYALFNNQVLKVETTQTLLTIHPNLGYTAYGLWGASGWGSFQETFYYRTGGIQGSTANWIHTMENKKTIIVLSNTNATNLYELSEKLYLASLLQTRSTD